IRALFWTVMAIAGLVTEGIFGAAGLVPAVRSRAIAPDHFSWDYTTYLNIVFLAVFGVLYWAYRNRSRLGGGGGLALDPVCGMQVEVASAPASIVHAGERVYFCSDRCRLRFGERVGDVGERPAEQSGGVLVGQLAELVGGQVGPAPMDELPGIRPGGGCRWGRGRRSCRTRSSGPAPRPAGCLRGGSRARSPSARPRCRAGRA